MTNSANNQVNNTTSTATQGATMNYITKELKETLSQKPTWNSDKIRKVARAMWASKKYITSPEQGVFINVFIQECVKAQFECGGKFMSTHVVMAVYENVRNSFIANRTPVVQEPVATPVRHYGLVEVEMTSKVVNATKSGWVCLTKTFNGKTKKEVTDLNNTTQYEAVLIGLMSLVKTVNSDLDYNVRTYRKEVVGYFKHWEDQSKLGKANKGAVVTLFKFLDEAGYGLVSASDKLVVLANIEKDTLLQISFDGNFESKPKKVIYNFVGTFDTHSTLFPKGVFTAPVVVTQTSMKDTEEVEDFQYREVLNVDVQFPGETVNMPFSFKYNISEQGIETRLGVFSTVELARQAMVDTLVVKYGYAHLISVVS